MYSFGYLETKDNPINGDILKVILAVVSSNQNGVSALTLN